MAILVWPIGKDLIWTGGSQLKVIPHKKIHAVYGAYCTFKSYM
ncbi:hypothetical protein AVEN_208927-1, partial [Araneus ventricosus]